MAVTITGPSSRYEVDGSFVLVVSDDQASQARSYYYTMTARGPLLTDPTDFVGGQWLQGPLTFQQGATAQTLTIPIAADSIFEGDEGFTVNLWDSKNQLAASFDGTIKNGSPPPVISIADAGALSEGDSPSNATRFHFALTRTGDLSSTSTVTFTVSSSQASLDDFLARTYWDTGSFMFNAGQSSIDLTIGIWGDTFVEPDETFTVTLSNPYLATLGTSVATGTILNDDVAAPPSLAVSGPGSKSEGNSGTTSFNFTVTRTGDVSSASSATYTVTGNGATGSDFSGGSFPTGTVSFAAGETSKTIGIPVLGDTAVEQDEAFSLTLSNPTGAVIATSSATGTILNDDTASVVLTISGYTVFAEDSTVSYTVTRNNIGSSASYSYALVGSGASPVSAADFVGGVLPSGVVDFAPSEAAKTITIAVAADGVVESNEQFTLSVASGPVTYATLDGVIKDNSPPASTLSLALAGPSSQYEGDSGVTTFGFTVNRTGDASGGASVHYTTGNIDADASDFVNGILPNGTVTFAPGETSKTISIQVVGDTIAEWDERFTVFLDNASGAGMGPNNAITATILTDDLAGPATLSIRGGGGFVEPDSGVVTYGALIKRSGDLSSSVSATYTIGGGSVDAADFGGAFPTGVVTLGPGETSRYIYFDVTGDTTPEPDEVFNVTLSNPVGGVIADASASFIIGNNDGPFLPTLFINGPGSKDEGDSGTTQFEFVVGRSGDTSTTASVSYTVTAVTALAADFAGGVLPSGTITFAPGEHVKTIAVGIVGDTVAEADGVFSVALSNPVGVNLGLSTSAVATILNDDAAPALLTFSGPSSVQEGSDGPTLITYTLTRTGDLSAAASVSYAPFLDPYSVASVRWDVTTLSPNDFTSGQYPSGTVNFAPGESVKTFTVSIEGDRTIENNELLTIDLHSPVNLTWNKGVVSTSILDDDVSETLSSFAAVGGGGPQPEGATFSYTLTRADGGKASTFTYAVVGSGSAPAAPDDFTGGAFPAGEIVFAVGELTKTLVIRTVDDSVLEPEEGFGFIIKNSLGFGIAAAGTTILDNDAVPPGPVAPPTPPTPQEAAAALSTAFDNILKAAPGSADAGYLATLGAQIAAGQTTRDQVVSLILDRADGTTSVATMAYQFFTGRIPSEAGMDYLVSPTGSNPNNLNAPYYQSFSIENRNINFALNLGKSGEGAAKFQAEYGGLDLFAATTKAYQTIFGTAPSADKVHALLDPSFSVGGQTMTRAEYFAYYGQDGANGIGTKAAMVGWLLAEAEKANIGTYAKSNAAFLMDLADGANYAVDIVGVYGKPEYAV